MPLPGQFIRQPTDAGAGRFDWQSRKIHLRLTSEPARIKFFLEFYYLFSKTYILRRIIRDDALKLVILESGSAFDCLYGRKAYRTPGCIVMYFDL